MSHQLQRTPGLGRWTSAAVLFMSAGVQAQLTHVWENRFNGPDSSVDLAWASAMDSQGNLVIAGSSPADNQHQAFITIKYGPAGTRLWERRVDASGDITFDRAVTVAVDAQDNVVVGGLVDDVATDFDGMVVKYAPDGQELWRRQLNFFGFDDSVAKVLTGADGTVWVAGTTHNGTFGHDTAMYLAQLNGATGEMVWFDTYEHLPSQPGQHNAPDNVMSATFDHEGSVIIVGITGVNTSDTGLRTTVLKYSTEGVRQWVFRDTLDVNRFNGTSHVGVSPTNDLYVVYAHGPFDVQWDTGMLKLGGSGGQVQWRRTFPGIASDSQRPIETLFDWERDRIVILTQIYNSDDFPVDEDVLMVAYDSAGALRWSRRWAGAAPDASDTCQGIVPDGQGGFMILVSTGNGPSFNYTDIDWMIQKYDVVTGAPGWTFRHTNPTGTPRSYRGKDLQFDAARRAVLVAGESAPDPTSAEPPSFDITAARFDLPRAMHCIADFNNDGDSSTDADIEAFFACLAGACCPLCGSADFNNDGQSATDADIESFFRVLAGGPC